MSLDLNTISKKTKQSIETLAHIHKNLHSHLIKNGVGVQEVVKLTSTRYHLFKTTSTTEPRTSPKFNKYSIKYGRRRAASAFTSTHLLKSRCKLNMLWLKNNAQTNNYYNCTFYIPNK